MCFDFRTAFVNQFTCEPVVPARINPGILPFDLITIISMKVGLRLQ